MDIFSVVVRKKGSFRLMFSQDKAYHVREDMAEVVKEIMS